MPFGDETGPAGMGPMTGRAAGFCAGYDVPGYLNPVPGRRFGGGRGMGRRRGMERGRGWRHGYYATRQPGWSYPTQTPYGRVAPPAGGQPVSEPTREQELEMLKQQAQHFENALRNINERISALDTQPAQE